MMLLVIVLLSSIKLSYGWYAEFGCSITNMTYNLNYTEILFSFPVKSTNTFYYQADGYYFDMTTQYNLSVPEVDCSVSNSSSYKNSSRVSQTLVGGTTCFFKTPVLFSLNLTVSGKTSLQTNRSNPFYGSCVGWIYINVTQPTPKPDPEPDPKPTPSPTPTPTPATQSQMNQLTKTLTIMGIVIIVLISLTLIFLVISKCKKNKSSSNFDPIPSSNNYVRQN